jgi:hypothetical protein
MIYVNTSLSPPTNLNSSSSNMNLKIAAIVPQPDLLAYCEYDNLIKIKYLYNSYQPLNMILILYPPDDSMRIKTCFGGV